MTDLADSEVFGPVFRDALDIIDEPVVAFDVDCKPVFLNRSFRETFSDEGAFTTACTFPGLPPFQLFSFFDTVRTCLRERQRLTKFFDFVDNGPHHSFSRRRVDFSASGTGHVVCAIKKIEVSMNRKPAPEEESPLLLGVDESHAAETDCCRRNLDVSLDRFVAVADPVPTPGEDASDARLGDSAESTSPEAIELADLRQQLLNMQRRLEESESEAQRQRERNEELIKAHQAALHVKSRFLAMISHEMKTPIAGVLTSLSLIKHKHLPADVADAVSIAQVCGSQLELIIGDMLDLAKMEESKVELECIPFRPHNTIDEALEIVCFSAEKNQIELMCDIQAPFPDIIKGDSGRLRQILVNLLSNACKFSHREGEVLLTAAGRDVPESDSYELSFAVHDWGVGIAEESKANLFQPFVQADSSITRKFGGTGLGLSICKRLVECMGGRIWFESELGRGSTFHFNVRVRKLSVMEAFRKPFLVDNHISRRSFSCLWNSDEEPLRVLLVDKNVNFLRSLQKRIVQWGWTAEIAHTSDQAYNVLRTRFTRDQTQKFDAVIIDTKQAVADPKIFERCRLLSGDTLVVQMGFVRVLEEENADVAASVPFIKKPIRPALLRSYVSEWACTHRNRQSIKHLFFQRRIRRNSVDDLATQETFAAHNDRRVATLDARQRRSLSFSPSEEVGDSADLIALSIDDRPRLPQSSSSRLFLPTASALFGTASIGSSSSSSNGSGSGASSGSQFLSPSSSTSSTSVLLPSGSTHATRPTSPRPESPGPGWNFADNVVPFAALQHGGSSGTFGRAGGTGGVNGVNGGLQGGRSMSRSTSNNDIQIVTTPPGPQLPPGPTLTDDCPPEGLRIALGRRGSMDSRMSETLPAAGGRHLRRVGSVVTVLTSPRSRSASSSPSAQRRTSPQSSPTATPPTTRMASPRSSPVVSPAAAKHARRKSCSNDGSYEMRILVAEDNAVNRHLLGRLLTSIGKFSVTMVDNGRRAVEAMQEEPFDLVLMDVCMPELDGWKATELIRGSSRVTTQPPIVAVTANSFEEDRQRCYTAGMDSIIEKPIKKESLAHVIRQYDPRVKSRQQPAGTPASGHRSPH